MLLVRGGVFGGTAPDVECFAKAYQQVLAATLGDGYAGTEENILALTAKWLPSLVAMFDNNSLGNHGDNCASFQANQLEVAGKGPY